MHPFFATLTLAFHALWILWMLTGAFLVRKSPRLKTVYLVCVVVTMLIAFFRGICPLTDVEQYFAAQAGDSSYEGGFVHYYLSQLVYLGDHFDTAAGLQVTLLLLLAIAILVNFRKLRF